MSPIAQHTSPIRRPLNSLSTPFLLIVVMVVASVLASTLGDASLRRIVVGALVNMIAVIGIYVFIGLTGVFSFGQLAFMAIGAYATAVLTVPIASKSALFDGMPEWLVQAQLPGILAVLVGAVLAAAVALVLSIPLARMNDITASLGTLAILVAVYVVAGNWSAVTNGSRGITAIPTSTTLVVALVVGGVVIVAVWLFQESPIGLKIRATREDAVAARAIGINVGVSRGIAFVASGFVVGIAGGLYAQLQGSLSPDAFYLGPTFILIAMLVVGGMSSLTGAVVGTLVITALRRSLQWIEGGIERPGLTEVGLGIALLAILAFRRRGITDGRELSWGSLVWFFGAGGPLRRSRRHSEKTTAQSVGEPSSDTEKVGAS
ncbi:branched-chain amino acid ABC transporter permease [Microbacterium koreense]|uniref:Branched-chain amino acid ABC transporter permease n=1 Tax=Microbacterium koreense TaxID=323761 RepID=A0ABW2ZN33_9MICO